MATSNKKDKIERLYGWNKWLAIVHALQGLAILLLSITKTVPITTNYLTTDPLATADQGHTMLTAATHQLFEVNVAWLVAGFFFVAALSHTLMATSYRKRYEAEVATGINRLRWIEFGIGSGLMLVTIGLLSGMYDLGSLLAIFALAVVANLAGLAMEVYGRGKREPNWLACGMSGIAGIVPWIIFSLYVFAANVYGEGGISGYVYGIYATMVVAFGCFTAAMYVQHKKKGKWSDYLYAERVYMLLSLATKTALAWQIYAGALRP